MPTSIDKIKVGSKLLLGKYTASADGEPEPIVWLKATPNCDFISERVLDYIVFDGKEPNNTGHFKLRQAGNPRYDVSNILSFANGDGEQWYAPMHEFDSPPLGAGTYQRKLTSYDTHQGFLYYFDEYEILSIIKSTKIVNETEVLSLIRLPQSHEIIGDDKFPLFKSRGVRPNPTADLISYKSLGFNHTSYISFWVADTSAGTEFYALYIDRAGRIERQEPFSGGGFRPVCSINPEIIIDEIKDGVYFVVPFKTGKEELCTNKDLLTLLGVN